ncbi:hypothetical protein CAEBREN_14828 [Caenorhabditis brenneri]|uniref:Uncharacterized protein n=1 Tax=Caenorhabditis brenneri TaxID=135651 RepID=G0P8Z4_CAEBE|nr:hypothetical protein CAEBREN_14828 [Caenorhabditis brenneri]
MVKHKAHGLLDVFPKRPNQKVVNGQDLLNTPRSTRSAGSKNLFTMCPYANTIVAYDSTNSEPKNRKTRNSYSPDPRNNTTIALVDSSSSNNATSKPVRSKSVMQKAVSKRPRAQAPPRRSPSQALPPQVDASRPSILNGNSPNDRNNTSSNNAPVRRRAVSEAPNKFSMPKGLKMASAKRSRSRAPAPGVSSTIARTPEPAPADVPGPSSPPQRALNSTSNTILKNASVQQMDDRIFPNTSAIPKGLKVMAPKRPRSRAPTSKVTPSSIVPQVVSAPLTTSTPAVVPALSIVSPDSKNNDGENDSELLRHVPNVPFTTNTPKGLEKVLAPKRPRSRAPTSKASSSELPQVVSSPSAGEVRAPTPLGGSPSDRKNNNVENTPKQLKYAPNASTASNTSKGFEKETTRKRPRSGALHPTVSTSSATLSPPTSTSSISCTSDPPSKMAKIDLATTAAISPTVIVDLAPSELAAKHQPPDLAKSFSSLPMRSPAAAVKVAKMGALNLQTAISSQIDAPVPSTTSSPMVRQARDIVETQSPTPGKGQLLPEPETAHSEALPPKTAVTSPLPKPTQKAPTPKHVVVSKPPQTPGTRARSVAPQQLSNQSPGRLSGATRAASVTSKKVANTAPKTTRKRAVKGNNSLNRAQQSPMMPQEPEVRDVDQNRNSPLSPRRMVFFPLNTVFDSSKDTTFKELHYTPKYARRKDTGGANVRGKRPKLEEPKGCSPVAVDVASLYQRQYCPLFVFGKLAIQYENFDFTDPCRFIKNLACFHEEHENLLIPILKLGDWEKIKELDEGNVEVFYKHEIVPAIENLRKFNEDPSSFYDTHKGQYERHLEDGVIIEYPLPPRPEIFPSQIRKRVSLDIYNEVNRRNEARARREEQAAARAHDAAIAAAMEAQRIAAAAAAAEIPMMNIHNHLDNLTAYHHQQMMNQMFMPQPFFYQPPPPPTPPMYPPPHNNMFYPGMQFQPPPMPFDHFFNNGFPMHEFDLQ